MAERDPKVRHLSGIWWLPGRSRRRVPGILTVEGRTPGELRLFGNFLPPLVAIRTSSIPIILGRTDRGKLVTLHDCHGPDLSGHREKYEVSQAYLGILCPTEGRLRFREALVQYKNLVEWVADSTWYHRTHFRWHSSRSPRVQLAWAGPSELIARTTIGTIALRADADVQIDSWRRARLTKQLWLRVALSQSRLFDSFHLDVLRPLANLISLATVATTPIQRVRLLVRKRVRVGEQVRIVRVPVEVLFRRPLDEDTWRVTPASIPFGLKHVERRLRGMLNRWFALYDLLRFPLDLFFSVHNAGGGYLEHRFLSLVQAAESYHANRIGGTELGRKEYWKRKQRILALIPRGYHSWVRDKLHNDLSLSRRLDGLFDQASETLKELVPDRALMIKAITRTRNHLAHGTPSFRPIYHGEYGLFRLIEVLSLLLQERFLRELGFSRREASAAIERNWKYGYALGLIAPR